MHILTCVCTFAHIYITTPQEKSRVKPWCVQSDSQVFLASNSFLCPLCSLPAHSQAFLVSSSFPGHFLAVQKWGDKAEQGLGQHLITSLFQFLKNVPFSHILHIVGRWERSGSCIEIYTLFIFYNCCKIIKYSIIFLINSLFSHPDGSFINMIICITHRV